jgi:hypothetical protein
VNWSFTRMEVIQTAIGMGNLREFAKLTFSELLELAPIYLEQAEKAIWKHKERQRYQLEQNREMLFYDEAAKLVTGEERLDQARRRFEKFRSYMRKADSRNWETMDMVQVLITDPAQSWQRDQCLLFREHYEKWQALTRAQKIIKTSCGRDFADFDRVFRFLGDPGLNSGCPSLNSGCPPGNSGDRTPSYWRRSL